MESEYNENLPHLLQHSRVSTQRWVILWVKNSSTIIIQVFLKIMGKFNILLGN